MRPSPVAAGEAAGSLCTFLTATRDTYDAIEERGRLAEAPRDTENHPDPESTDLLNAKATIERNFGKVKRAVAANERP